MRRPLAAFALALCVGTPAPARAATDPEVAALLERVQFWESRNREDLAREALDRALRRAPEDPDALMVQARYQLRANLEREATATYERMKAASPGHPNVARLAALLRIHGPDRERLRQARQLARAGRNDEAVRAYRAIFPDAFPDDDTALEFARVLGWASGGWDEARAMLADLARRHPNDPRYRVALAAHQSTRKPVSPETLKTLREMAQAPTVAISRPAREAWRRAVLAMDPVAATLPFLREYIAANPGETAVQDRLEAVRQQIARGGRPAPSASVAPAAPGPKEKGWAALEAGRFDEAGTLFEEAIGARPGDGEAVGGLGLARMRQDRHAEAVALLERARGLDARRAAKWEELAREARYWLLLRGARAEREAGRLAQAEERARQARTLDPKEPNVAAELARIVLAAGRDREAEVLAREAADEQRRAILESIAAVRAERQREAGRRLEAEGREAEALAAFESGAALAPDDPWVRHDLARLLARRGDTARAQALFDDLLRRRPGDADARYAHALYLSSAEREPEALLALEAIPAGERSPNMTRLQRRLWTTVQGRRALALADLGRRAEAERVVVAAQAAVGGERELAFELARILDRMGAVAPLRSALDALGAGPATPEESRALSQLRLSLRLRESDALEAEGRPGEALASLQAWVPAALEANPGDARLLGLAARLADRQGRPEEAIDYEQRSLAAGGGDVYRWRRLGERLDRQATWSSAAFDALQRSGTPGQSRVSAQELSLGLVRGETEGGRWSMRLAPARISSGHVDLSETDANTFGSALLCRPSCAHSADDAEEGIALGAAWERGPLRLDLGTTPLGFPVANVLGGVSYKGDLGPLSMSLDASRRPVASSHLSYAGMRDPNTGREWGGVIATGARVSFSRDQGGDHGAWGLAGAYRLTGRNVVSNDKGELMAGYYRRLVNEEDRVATAGVTAMLWRFGRNAGEFTFGHGGYYSPRSFRSLSLPLTYGLRTERAAVALRAAVSVSWSSGREAPFFPTDEELQARAQAIAPSTFVDPFHSGGSGGRSFGRSLSAVWEYQLTPGLFAGGRLELERSVNYTPNRFLLYVRMADRAAARPVALPPEPGLPGWQQ